MREPGGGNSGGGPPGGPAPLTPVNTPDGVVQYYKSVYRPTRWPMIKHNIIFLVIITLTPCNRRVTAAELPFSKLFYFVPVVPLSFAVSPSVLCIHFHIIHACVLLIHVPSLYFVVLVHTWFDVPSFVMWFPSLPSIIGTTIFYILVFYTVFVLIILPR